MDFDAIVIGAGAAGMFCAANAAQRGRRVLLVEHSDKLGEKIRISGGGRCNFTNRDCPPEAFVSQNPRFARSALARYAPRDFLALVERHAIRWHEKTLGQLFCDDSAAQIIALLKAECDAGGVSWAMPAKVERVARREASRERDRESRFDVATTQGGFSAASLVVATGGLSIPKLGATPLGYKLAEQFGLPLVAPKPALVPLAAPPEWLQRFAGLSGASFETVASLEEPKKARGASAAPPFREAALVTHRGLSGPAILQISSYWQLAGARGAIALDLLPGVDAAEWLGAERRSSQQPAKLLEKHLPKRFAQALAEAEGWRTPPAQLANTEIARIAATLKAWRFRPAGTLGFEKAEVTLGGVDTGALSQQTLEARSVPGLYFIGEVVDVTGWLGGYNFQWAWSSAYAAAQAV